MKPAIRAAALSIGALVAFAAAPARAEVMEFAAATVNDEPITNFDVIQRMRLILVSTGVQPTPELFQRVRAQALRALIDETVQLQEAKKFPELGNIDQARIDAEIDRIAKQNSVTRAEIEKDLAAAGVNISTLERQLRAEIAWADLINGRYRARTRISSDQIDEALERLAANASKPQYLVSEILIEPPSGASQAAIRGALDAVYGQLQAGAPFPAVARQFSAASSAIQGGDVGWVLAGELRPEVEKVISTLNPGQISPPIETADGFYIMALRERRSAANVERLELKQIVTPFDKDATEDQIKGLERAMAGRRDDIKSCAQVEKVAGRIDGATASDLGVVAIGDLAAPFQSALEGLEPGRATAPVRTANAVVMLAVCGRRLEGAGIPSREEIEDRLLGQQLSSYSRRYLRDLRNTATIEMPER